MPLIVCDHPLLQDALSRLRAKDTPPESFRELASRAALLLGAEALRRAPLKAARVRTPLAAAPSRVLASPPAFVAVLRAGLGLLDGLLRLAPSAAVGHIGLYRDEETLSPVRYYVRLPRGLGSRLVVLCDPMLATGGSAAEAIHILKGAGARRIVLLTLLAAKKGVERVRRDHPEVPVYTAAVDPVLNAKGYIVPGLGDAGDRLFNT